MKWNKKNDTFVLSRDELADLHTFCIVWMFRPAKERPIGYAKFHKEILCPASKLLMKYLIYIKDKNGKRIDFGKVCED